METGIVKWFNNAKGFGLFARLMAEKIFLLIIPVSKWTVTGH